MKIAIVAAGFTPAEADRLRRAMATFRRSGLIHQFRDKLIEGMAARGYERDFAERCFRQIEGFGTYGFPESHAASFALLVYVSAWLKCAEPAVFACALLNSQPMGFYAPAQIVRDAREHGVEVRPVDVNGSDWDHTLEATPGGGLALRLGLRQIKGLAAGDGEKLVAARPGGGYRDLAELKARSGLGPAALDVLARGDAMGSLGLSRREALWTAIGFERTAPPPLLAGLVPPSAAIRLPAMTPGEAVTHDYRSLGLSLRAHPVALLRSHLKRARAIPAAHLAAAADGSRLTVAGLVLVRQRPGTASGVIFVTLEDETGIVNLIVWPQVFERQRRAVLAARLLLATGRLQREGMVVHLVAERLVDRSALLHRLTEAESGKTTRPAAPVLPFPSRDFH